MSTLFKCKRAGLNRSHFHILKHTEMFLIGMKNLMTIFNFLKKKPKIYMKVVLKTLFEAKEI